MKEQSKPEGEPVIQDPCLSCGKTLREQMKGCNVIYCYRQFLKPEPSAEEILQSRGVQFPASRSPRDYNLTLIAMEEYAAQFKPKSSALQERISELESRLNRANDYLEREGKMLRF